MAVGKGIKHLKKQVVSESVYELAIERLNNVYDRFDHIAVLFSGGKDSTVCLQLALEVARARNRLPLDVVMCDEEAIPFQTEDYVRRVSQMDGVNLRWMCLPVLMINGCSRTSPWWWAWAPEAKDNWCRPLPPEGITDLPGFVFEPPESRPHFPNISHLMWYPDQGSVGVILGIRAQESLTRQRMVTCKADDNYIVQYDYPPCSKYMHKIYPIYDWTDHDVWTAPDVFGWDYNYAYNVMAAAGVSMHNQRCSPAFGFEPLQKLWTYKTCFPEIWEKMIDRVDGANTAVRYAVTELYGYGKLPDKPSDIRWESFLIAFLKKHDPETAKVTAMKIKTLIARHYSATQHDPILYEVPHPDTGLSWGFLQMLAMRADPKGRKDPGSRSKKLGTPEYDKAWAKYNKELDKYNKGGADGGSRF